MVIVPKDLYFDANTEKKKKAWDVCTFILVELKVSVELLN